mmetsp:Transcript_2535/g.3923  ORF Transcript_2535/g.3923 Transcript_2535/m.3923 type:complete len:209 (+) Transcript_2535:52-678(+)
MAADKTDVDSDIWKFLAAMQQDVSVFTAQAARFAVRVSNDACEVAAEVQTKIDLVTSKLEPYTSRLQPWHEFVVLQTPDLDKEPLAHIARNLAYFQANYLLLATMVIATSIYMHTTWLLAVLLLIAVWIVNMTCGGLDPTWNPVIGKLEITAWHRLTALYMGSILVIFIVIGKALLIEFGALGSLTFMHAASNPGFCSYDVDSHSEQP